MGLDQKVSKDDIHTYKKSDLVYLAFTSGSTGEPKGIIQTDRNISPYNSELYSTHPYVLTLETG